MSLPKEKAMKNLAKAWKSPNIGKRGPHKSTLAKHEARKLYEEKMSQVWEEILEIHLKSARKIENKDERKEAIHQFIGKPVETIEATVTNTLKIDV